MPVEENFLFSPHVLIFGLAFDDKLFKEHHILKQPGNLARLTPDRNYGQVAIEWRPDKLDKPFFDELQTYDKMARQVTLSDLVGFALDLNFYCFRRGNASSLDESCS